MISVILTTHHGRLNFLKKAIASVLVQSFKNFELIIVDDCSRDGTEKYVNSLLSDTRIKYIRLKNPFGTDTRPKNVGIKSSKGEYISFLDSDNQYRKDHLQILYDAIKKHPDIDIVYGDSIIIYYEGFSSPKIGISYDFDLDLLMERNYIDTSDVLIKRGALFDVGGWDERYKKYVDWNLWVRMAKAGKKFLRVPKIITDYYIHKAQKSLNMHTKNDYEEEGIFAPEWYPNDLEIELPYLKKPRLPRIAVFSLTKDRLFYTKTCFKSLEKKAGYPYTHIIVDNGSNDGTVNWLKEYYKASPDDRIIIFNRENRGVAIGSNIAVDIAVKNNFDIIVKYDNDCFSISEEWLRKIVELYNCNHITCFSPYPEGLCHNPGGAQRILYGMIKGHLLGFARHLGGICHISPSSVYKKFRWKIDTSLHGLKDWELSQWLLENGYKMAYVEDLRIEHFESTEGQYKRYPDYFELRKKEKITIYKE